MAHAYGIAHVAEVLAREGIPHDRLRVEEISLVDLARDALADAFVRAKRFSHALLVDSDVGVDGGDVLRMVRGGVAWVCGAVPVRGALASGGNKFHLALDVERTPTSGGLVPITHGLLDFALLRRDVFERLAECSTRTPRTNSPFEPLVHYHHRDRVGEGEDRAMARRWNALGERAWALDVARVTHGNTSTTPRDAAPMSDPGWADRARAWNAIHHLERHL